MAGICGIVIKGNHQNPDAPEEQVAGMIRKLGCSDNQPSRYVASSNFGFGNVSLLSDSGNSNFIYNESLGITCIVDGLVFVGQEIKTSIQKEYQTAPGISDKEYLPYLFASYGKNIPEKITGYFNIFILDQKNGSASLFNDILGYTPLYYYDDPKVFLFASKIESILASTLLPEPEFDVTTCLEHIYFNYTLSDNTFIKGIRTLSPASRIDFFSDGMIQISRYKEFNELFVQHPENRKEGIDLLNEGLRNAVQKLHLDSGKTVNLTLTGGWDSRVVLSYLLPYKNQVQTYSFGAPGSPDITIPQQVSGTEGLKYKPILLDHQYLQDHFALNAGKTIMLSNGTRHFKRSHFLYAIEQAAQYSDTIVSGIYGDEVLKITGPKPGDVLSKNIFDFIRSDFDTGQVIRQLKANPLNESPGFPQSSYDEMAERMNEIRNSMASLKRIQEKYYHFRFQITLRKFFGAEINGYNDHCYNFSPFIDTDFLKAYFRSSFCGIFYPFNSDSILLKRQTTALYGKLISRNHKPLLSYPTDRGYSMADALSIWGMGKILISHFLRKETFSDAFNTQKTTALFRQKLLTDKRFNNTGDLPFMKEKGSEIKNPNALSLLFWMGKIREEYNVH